MALSTAIVAAVYRPPKKFWSTCVKMKAAMTVEKTGLNIVANYDVDRFKNYCIECLLAGYC